MAPSFAGTLTTVERTLNKVTASGRVTVLADTWDYEQRLNPDVNRNYGFQGLGDHCAVQVPAEVGGGKPFGGIVESNPYAVARSGGTYDVADAAASAILKWMRRSGSAPRRSCRPCR